MYIILFLMFIFCLIWAIILSPFIIYFLLAPIIGTNFAEILSIGISLPLLIFSQGMFGGRLDKLAKWCAENS